MTRRWLIVGGLLLAIAVISVASYAYWGSGRGDSDTDVSGELAASSAKDNVYSRSYSRGKCAGEGPVEFTHSPMDYADIGSILPYGTMVGAHVIPTDHGYFGPKIFNSPRDAYPVYAIADGVIVNVSHRSQSVGDGPKTAQDEYQLLFEYTCTFYSYYDLLTSLVGDVAEKVGKLEGFNSKLVRIPVKAGQEIGRIGGQTVDFGVWNFQLEPAKVANPDSYKDNLDRLYLDDMYAYFAPAIRDQLLALSARVVEPKSGTIHYDIVGKLVGNWFKEGSNGFTGSQESRGEIGSRYWDGHLSVSYDYIDPTAIKFSIGNWNGEAVQFAVKGNTPDPKDVSVETGLVKYELVQGSLINGDTGASWMLAPPIANPKFLANNQVQGTVLIQLTGANQLKLELFPGKTATQVTAFTGAAQIYVR